MLKALRHEGWRDRAAEIARRLAATCDGVETVNVHAGLIYRVAGVRR